MGFFDRFKESLDTKNNMSPFGEAGLLFDPLAYVGDAVGKGDEYRNFMRKTWEYPNKYLGQGVAKFNTFDRKINPLHKAIDKTEFGQKARDIVENKPADVIGSIFGGGAIMGGLGGGAAGGSSGLSTGAQEAAHGLAGGGNGIMGFGGAGTGGIPSNMFGSFANTQMGTGNVGSLFANTGINTGGVGGVGSTGAGGFMQQAGGPQGLMKMGQGMMSPPQQQQSQQQQPKPYWVRGKIVWM